MHACTHAHCRQPFIVQLYCSNRSVLQRHPAVHWHPCSLEPPAMNTGWNDSLSKQAVQDLLGTCIASNAASNGR
eukprot:scaffold24856_cov19-Tisochrysis_lutea.AAC.5